MRKNVSIGKRFASGVSPSPRVEQKSCTVDGWPKRIIIVVSLGYRYLSFSLSRNTSPFSLSFAVKLHFKHVYRFFLHTREEFPDGIIFFNGDTRDARPWIIVSPFSSEETAQRFARSYPIFYFESSMNDAWEIFDHVLSLTSIYRW